MPFRYRLQKVLDFRVRKKEEQLMVVQKAQQKLLEAEERKRKNEEEITQTKLNMRQADPMMFETYDKYLQHLWEKAEVLEQERKEAEIQLDIEKKKLTQCEQAVKVLEKHKEKNKEAYLAEEKAAELKSFSELGVTRFFKQSLERQEEEEQDIMKQLELIDKLEVKNK